MRTQLVVCSAPSLGVGTNTRRHVLACWPAAASASSRFVRRLMTAVPRGPVEQFSVGFRLIKTAANSIRYAGSRAYTRARARLYLCRLALAEHRCLHVAQLLRQRHLI
jgi:hypothetical protein